MRARSASKVLGIAETATPGIAKSAFLALSQRVHPDHCAHPAAGAAFARLRNAHRQFKPTSARAWDPRAAEFQGDALTTAGWLYDEAARATRRHRDSRTLDGKSESSVENRAFRTARQKK
jgi:hypothetical protein